MVMGGDFTWGGEHTVQYTDGDVLKLCTSETYILLLTNNFIPIISIKIKNEIIMIMKIKYQLSKKKAFTEWGGVDIQGKK